MAQKTIVWANIDSRWRDAEYDERLSYEEKDSKLKIIQTFNDGSVDIKEYKKGELSIIHSKYSDKWTFGG